MRSLVAATFAALLIVLLSIPASAGDPCRRVSYSAPLVQYQTGYVHQVYDQNIVLVPKAFQVQVHPQFYASVGDEYRQAAFAKLVAQELAALQTERSGYAAPPKGTELKTEALTLPKQPAIKAVLAANCTGCHSADGKQKPDLSGNVDEVTRLRAFLAVSTGHMPKNGKPLNDADLNTIAAWADEKVHPPAAPKMPPAK